AGARPRSTVTPPRHVVVADEGVACDPQCRDDQQRQKALGPPRRTHQRAPGTTILTTAAWTFHRYLQPRVFHGKSERIANRPAGCNPRAFLAKTGRPTTAACGKAAEPRSSRHETPARASWRIHFSLLLAESLLVAPHATGPDVPPPPFRPRDLTASGS